MSGTRIADLDEETREAGRLRFESVRSRIEAAAKRAGRDPASVSLVGVAKKQPTPRILAAIAAGVHVLGESYVQEARVMRPEIEAALAGDPEAAGLRLEWRMVGRLQRNKAALASRLFDAVESVDRPELVDALARRAADEGRRLDVLVQVSLCEEPQKGGCEEDDLPAIAERVVACPSLRLRGLMTVPSASEDPEQARPAFRRLRTLHEALSGRASIGPLDTLSMGMSGDLEVAVEEGATLVRVGTALFGDRIPA